MLTKLGCSNSSVEKKIDAMKTRCSIQLKNRIISIAKKTVTASRYN